MCLFCIFSSNAFASNDNESIPSQVKEAAEQGLKSFLVDATQSPSDFGYDDANEVSKAQLGEGNKLYTIDKNLLSNNSESLIDYAIETGAWLFTIDVDNVPKNYLTVGFEDGAYKVVQVGGNAESYGLAKSRITTEYGKSQVIQAGSAYYFLAKSSNKDVILSSVPDNKASQFRALGNGEYKTTNDVLNFLNNQRSSENDNLRSGSNMASPAKKPINDTIWLITGIAVIGIAAYFTMHKKVR